MMTPEERKKRAKRISQQAGANPMILGQSVALGGQQLYSALLNRAPYLLADLLESGTKIDPEQYGKPIEELAEFTGSELRAIRNFAKEQKVQVPIVAGKDYQSLGEPTAQEELVQRIQAAITGRETPRPPAHISVSGTSLPYTFHEIGHASKPFKNTPLAQGIYRELGAASRGIPRDIAQAIIATQGLIPTDENTSSTGKFVHKYAPFLVGATAIPEVVEEGRASLKALGGLRRAGVGLGAGLKELAPAFATYLGAAAAPALATALAQKLVKYLYEHAGSQSKHAADPKMGGNLRASTDSAWRVGSAAPKPKSTPPGKNAKTMPVAKPPSNRSYHKDTVKAINDPSHGVRLSLNTNNPR